MGVKTCFICGKTMRLKHKSNYEETQVNEFAFASRKIPEYMHFDLYECKFCKLLSSEKKYEVDELNKKYKEADFDSSTEAQYASKTYIKYITNKLPDFVPKKILDIGTGEGSYLKEAKQAWNNVQVVGCEPSEAPVNVADPEIKQNIINEPFSSDKFEKEEFDIVSCFQTIEHIPDSINLLLGIKTILKKDGYVYFVCHDYCSFINRIMGLKSPIYDIEHLQIYSKKSIRLLFEKAGFHDIELFTIKNIYPLNYWIRLAPIIPARLKKAVEKLKIAKKLMLGINVGNIGIIAKK